MRFMPCFRNAAPEAVNDPRYVGARHLMKSSSTPPAVVTMAETCLCWTSHLSVSRRPEEIKFEVYPKNIVVLSSVSGSRHLR